jgi:hypothetical protein
MEDAALPNKREARRNRRAPGVSAGGNTGCDGRLRPELTGFPPAGGDRRIAGCSAVNCLHRRITSVRTSAFICVICGFSVASVAFVPLCLRVCDVRGRFCVSASLRFFSLCSFSVSLCLCGSTGGRAGTETGTETAVVALLNSRSRLELYGQDQGPQDQP